MRVAEKPKLTDPEAWYYVNSKSNSANDIKRGKMLAELAKADGIKARCAPSCPNISGHNVLYYGYLLKMQKWNKSCFVDMQFSLRTQPADYNRFKSNKQLLMF